MSYDPNLKYNDFYKVYFVLAILVVNAIIAVYQLTTEG